MERTAAREGASGDRELSVLGSQRLTLALSRAEGLAGYPVGQPGSGKQGFLERTSSNRIPAGQPGS